MKTESTLVLHAQLALTAYPGTHRNASLVHASVALAVLCFQGHRKLFVTNALLESVVSLIFCCMLVLVLFNAIFLWGIYGGSLMQGDLSVCLGSHNGTIVF